MSIMCRPVWPFLLMYGSHDVRHTGFSQVDGGQRDTPVLGRHTHFGLSQTVRERDREISNLLSSIHGISSVGSR